MGRLLTLLILLMLATSSHALQGIDNTHIFFHGNAYTTPGGMVAIIAGEAEQDRLVVQYSREKDKDFIQFWNETQNPLFDNIQCALEDFFEHAYNAKSSSCDSKKVQSFRESFVAGWVSGVIETDAGRFYYTESESLTVVFYLDAEQRIIHLDSDCLDKNRLISFVDAPETP